MDQFQQQQNSPQLGGRHHHDDVYIDQEGNKHVEHHSHHDKEKNSTSWAVGACLCIFGVFVLVMFFLYIAYFVKTDNHGHEIHHLAVQQQKLLKEKEIQEMSDLGNIVYNMASKNRLSLCYTGFYYTLTDDYNASLKELNIDSNTAASLFAEQQQRRKRDEEKKTMRRKGDDQPYYYLIDARLIFEFNVHLENLIKDQDRLNHLKSTNKPFMSIETSITSNYHQFSTIKLIEMGLDAQTRLLKPLHTPIVLCSQNPYLKHPPLCYSSQVKSPLLSLKYKMVTEMSYSSTQLANFNEVGGDDVIFGKESTTTTETTTTNGVKKNSTTKESETSSSSYELLPDNHRHGSALYDVKEFVEGIRIYTIHFYKEDRESRITNDDDERGEKLVFKETVIVSVNPNKCN